MKVIQKGENVIIRRNLLKADESALLLADITSLTVDIKQGGDVIDTLTYPGAYIRQGESTSQVEIEISTTNSNKFKAGKVSLRYTIIANNADFSGEGTQKDIIQEDVLSVQG